MRSRVFSLLAVFVAAILLTAGISFAGTTERVSVDSSGVQGNGYSKYFSISANGRYVAFASDATNLVPGDTNGKRDIFVHDRATGITKRVSVNSSGVQGNNNSLYTSISADGRYVAFTSGSTNLVPGDTNGKYDIFVHDRATGITERVSVASDGVQGNMNCVYSSISADGRYVAFDSYATNLVSSDTNDSGDIFVHDRTTGLTECVSVASDGVLGNGDSGMPSISADGRYVAIDSGATNLVPDDTNGVGDIFVHDRTTGSTERVSVDSGGGQGNSYSHTPSISADGGLVAFSSAATNLVPGDTNGTVDIFVHDRATGLTEIVSVSSTGVQGNSISQYSSISADGSYVAFYSAATNLVPGDTNGTFDIFVHDRATGLTEIVSVSSTGVQGNGFSSNPASPSIISADGSYVAFYSAATNLVPGDTNGVWDIFVHDIYGDGDGDGFVYPTDCNDYDGATYPGAPETKHDGIDQDCNGSDLTIDITKAVYTLAEDSLRVEATSALNGAANLELVGYGPMTWKLNQTKWVINVQPAGGNPGTVTVSGPEGSETATVVTE